MELDVRHLRLVVAVADTGAVSAAARRLGVAQPTVSVQLRRIEAAVGRELFDRGSDGVTVTDAGRRVLRHARKVLHGVDRMADEAARVEPGGTLRIAATGPLDGVLADLHRRRPEVRWAVLRTTADGCRAALRDGAVDLALVVRHDGDPDPGGDADADLAVRAGPPRRLHVLMAATHPRAAEPLVDLRDLAGDRWVAGTDRHDPVLRECRAAGLEPDIAFRVPDRGTAHRLVADGIAVTLAVPGPAAEPGVVAVPYRGAGAVSWLVLRTNAPADLVDDVLAALESAGSATGRTDSAPLTGAPAGTPQRPLRLGGPPSPVTAGLPALLRADGVVGVVRLCGAAQLVTDLGAGRIDLALHHDYPGLGPEHDGTPPDTWPARTAVEAEPLMLALPAGHRLSGRSGVALAELRDETWVLPAPPLDRLRAAVLGLQDEIGMRPRVAAAWTHGSYLHGLLVAHDAVTVVGAVAPDERLELVPLTDLQARRRVTVVRRGAAHADAAAIVARAWADRLLDLAHPAARPRIIRAAEA